LSEVEKVLEPVRQQLPIEIEKMIQEYGAYIESTLRALPQAQDKKLQASA
jgi:hypothetical protein